MARDEPHVSVGGLLGQEECTRKENYAHYRRGNMVKKEAKGPVQKYRTCMQWRKNKLVGVQVGNG